MRFKLFIFKILLLFICLRSNAQYSEVGIFGGGSHFIGDVGHYGLHVPKGYGAGVFFRYNFDRRWSLKVQANYGYIRNEDSTSGIASRVNRNLHFESTIIEGSITAEFNFFEYEPGSKYWHTPYVLGGFGIFSFNPMASYEGESYELQPLGTEGQGTLASTNAPYALSSSFFVFGMGYKFAIGDITTIGIETSFRSTNTDYLDDVSGLYADPDLIELDNGPVAAALSDRSILGGDKRNIYRGDPSNNDWYIFTGITLQFKFEEIYEKCANFVGRR